MLRRLALSVVVWFAVSSFAVSQPTVVEVKHDAQVLALAWSHDGKQVVSADQNGGIRITEHPSGKEILVLNAGAAVSGIVFSRDGKLLGLKSGGTDGPLSVWDIAGKKKLKQLAFKGYSCSDLAFTDDGQTLVAAGAGEHMIWHHSKGGGSGSKSGKVPDGSAPAVSSAGKIVAWANPAGFANFFHIDQRKFQRMQLGPTTALALSPDDRWLAVGNPDKTIRLWAVQGSELKKFEGLRDPAAFLNFSANGKLLAGASATDPVVRIWDLASTHLRRRVTVGSTGVKALALSPDGISLAVANGSKLQVWNVATRDLGDLGNAKELSPDAMKTAWEHLGGGDPNRSEASFRELASAQQFAVGFLKDQIRAVAVPPVDWNLINQSIEDLDDVTYAKRERAMGTLAKQGEFIQPALEKYLDGKPTLEGEKRATKLLQRLVDPELTPDRLRCLEGIEILELLNSKESLAVLEDLSRDSLLTQIRLAARDARDRLTAAAKVK